MLQAVPRHIRQKLEQTLAQWPQWHCIPVVTRAPTLVKSLTLGISNYSFLVESEQHFVVRIDGLNPSAHDLCRQAEWCTLEQAHNLGLTPRPCYFNPDLGSLVCDYLAPDNAQDLNLGDVARLLHRIHRLPARHHRLNLNERVLRYEKHLEHQDRAMGEELQACREKLSPLLQELNELPVETVLCHNDLLRANRVYSRGKLWALDWEYCAMGSPWYDLAVVVNGDELTPHQEKTLLQAYLGRSPNDWERSTMHLYGCVYRYLELVWYLALDKPILEANTVEEKTARLMAMLAQAPH